MAEEQSLLKTHLYSLPHTRQLITVVISELVGTACLVFFGCLTLIAGFTLLSAAIGWGFVVANIIQVFGPLSGAHVNPSVTVASVVLGKMSLALALIYIVTQFLGALLGFGILKGVVPVEVYNASSIMTPHGNAGVACNFPSEYVTPLQAVIIELLATSFLVLIVCSVHDPRNRFHKDSFPLKVGGVIIADVIAIGPLTGAGLNPARAFAPALINNFWYAHWVYWVGPLGAGVIAPIFYMMSFDLLTGNAPENPAKTEAAHEIIAKITS